MSTKTLTFVLNDPPYESARSTTALRLVDAAIRRGYDVNVFAYEGAVSLACSQQAPHANTIHGRDVEGEDHPNPKNWIAALQLLARQNAVRLDWLNCGQCSDERGVAEPIAGVRRGSPADLWAFVRSSVNTLVIPTR
jgi:tRNA 2-thiouridine synthesizing protein D